MALTVLAFSSPFLADGFGDGTCTLLDVSGLVTNSICRISADGQPTKVGKIQKVTGQVVTVISVVNGLPLDLTSYLVARNAKLAVTGQTVSAGRQVVDPRPVL